VLDKRPREGTSRHLAPPIRLPPSHLPLLTTASKATPTCGGRGQQTIPPQPRIYWWTCHLERRNGWSTCTLPSLLPPPHRLFLGAETLRVAGPNSDWPVRTTCHSCLRLAGRSERPVTHAGQPTTAPSPVGQAEGRWVVWPVPNHCAPTPWLCPPLRACVRVAQASRAGAPPPTHAVPRPAPPPPQTRRCRRGVNATAVWQGGSRHTRVAPVGHADHPPPTVVPPPLPRLTDVRALPAPVDSVCRCQPPPRLPVWVWVQGPPSLGACARCSPTAACAWSAPAGGLRAPNPSSPTVSHQSWPPFTFFPSLVVCTNPRPG